MNSRAEENKPELWFEEDRHLSFAESVTIKATGECFKVEDKLARIHTYMVDQYNSYRANGNNFYEDQRDIATKCKCTPKTLGKWMKVLQALGLLVIDESQKSHSYTVRSVVSQEHNLIFDYPKLLNGQPSYDHEKALERLRARRGTAGETDGKVIQVDFKKQTKTPEPQPVVVETNYKIPTINRKSTGSAASTAGQRYSMASNDDGSSDDRADGNNEMKQEGQNYDPDPPFPPEKREPEETAGQVMAPLDDLRYWSYVGDDGRDDYGVMWGVSGADLDNLIGEHLKIREAEAEKNFLNRRG